MSKSKFKNNKPFNRNFKIIGSIFYYYIIEYFKKEVPKIEDKERISIEAYLNQTNGKVKELKLETLQYNENLDEQYLLALQRFEKNKNNYLLNDEEQKLLIHINPQLPSYPNDTNYNEVNCISSKVYKEYELNPFFVQVRINKYNITQRIEDLIKKLYNFISPKEN